MSPGDGRHGHISLDNSNYSSHNRGIYHSSDNSRGGSRSQDTSHSLSRNSVVYNFDVDGIVGTRSQETSHSSSHNLGERVGVDGRGGYRPQTNHSSCHNPDGRGRLLSSSIFVVVLTKKIIGMRY